MYTGTHIYVEVQANNESISSVMMLYVMNFAKLLLQN